MLTPAHRSAFATIWEKQDEKSSFNFFFVFLCSQLQAPSLSISILLLPRLEALSPKWNDSSVLLFGR